MIDYDAHDWDSHLFDIKGSMLREIVGRVLTCVVWSALVVLFHKFVYPVSISTALHTLVGVALGLLLVFRTNACYDRFWEGRRRWGTMVNESRNLARQAYVHLEAAPDLVDRILRWNVAFVFASMHDLRNQVGIGPVASTLPQAEVDAVLSAPNVPLAAATRISLAVREARDRGLISDFLLTMFDQNVQIFLDAHGACERIHKTPLPFAYMVHVRRALILYCFTLPFALVEPYGWLTIADTLMATYIFFGIEEIGVEIEDPFGIDDNDLPLESICGTITRNLLEVSPEDLVETPTTASIDGPPAASRPAH